MWKKKRKRAYVALNKQVVFATIFTTLILEINDISDENTFFYFQDDLKDLAKMELDRWDIQILDDVIATAKSLTKAKGLTKANVEERIVRIRATTIRTKGRKILLTIRVCKANRRIRKSHRSFEAHASYAMTLIG